MNAFTSLFPTTEQELDTRLKAIVRRVSPQWPLRSFVAVNPFMARSGVDFAQAALDVARSHGAHLLPDPALPSPVETLSDAFGKALNKPLSDFVTGRISQWAAGFYDQGQAVWGNPWQGETPFAAWRAEALHDRAPEIFGLKGFRAQVAALPTDAVAAAEALLTSLNLPAEAQTAYLERLICTVGGWAAWMRHRDWEAQLDGRTDEGLRDLLVIRLAWDVLSARALSDEGTLLNWRRALCAPRQAVLPDVSPLEARETHWREGLFNSLRRPAAPAPAPVAQAVFCIDVRSELYRHALEQAGPSIETLGFAGFFGLPIAVELTDGRRQPACPPLLRPGALVCEAVPGKASSKSALSRAVEGLKRTGASAFGYVESFGLASAQSLAATLFAKGSQARRAATEITLSLPFAQQADMAAGLLKGAGLTQPTAKLVVLVGHEGESLNNPHAAGLHCGACGGRSGAVNARAAALMVNHPEVRRLLRAEKGIDLSPEVWFAAAIHNTTTDELSLLDEALIPAHLHAEAEAFKAATVRAGERMRRLRAPTLNEAPTLKAFRRRASDPSQVRPEWALAGCAGFIAAPRHLTRGKDLGGRVFLHSYDWRNDDGFAVLEQILTAPVIVASWINLQYFASTVAPEVFGAGNKVLHNVVGGNLGVLEGNGGDLRLGLPLQSVFDGQTFRHEALRLSVVIAAPTEAIDGVLSRHASLRDLVENRWIHLFAADETGETVMRRTAQGWHSLSPETEVAA
ncbi:DUF2309 domain-containing protein [Asticcacaulis sp. DXS10W]|uniref:Probable inorganic carbon transporter subunit DabA n=1 Tax=Asticcacaulis currens TaxID=2984210 RepID=A0ABT5IDX8_9CAUL|nr:DUF2309 domain-containing protein [Asticcacaulis currens]MDC7694402.1 DUF2309 domain-containing protein [Asticcacaulis currens]